MGRDPICLQASSEIWPGLELSLAQAHVKVGWGNEVIIMILMECLFGLGKLKRLKKLSFHSDVVCG